MNAKNPFAIKIYHSVEFMIFTSIVQNNTFLRFYCLRHNIYPIICYIYRSIFQKIHYSRLISFRFMSCFPFLLLIATIFSCNAEVHNLQQSQNEQINHFTFISSLKPPATLEWCNEKYPLDIPEIRERAEREFYLLLQQPGQIILYLKRSGRYFPLFERILREMGMPEDIKYLAVAESALYMSFSPKGAGGLWQFMPESANRMGLIVNDEVDERLHPEKSTFAALKYLKSGHENFKSWAIAAAGYNMGYSGIMKQIDLQTTDNYFELFLNEETSRFLFRIAIIKEIMKNPEKYGFIISKGELYKPEKVKTIKVNHSINNLSQWANQNNTKYKDVRLLNPWIKKPYLPKPPKNYYWEIAIPEN